MQPSNSRKLTSPEFAAVYAENNWVPIPIRRPSGASTGKEPACKWRDIRTPGEGLSKFRSDDTNVGIILGERSNNLVDVDIDCDEALTAADLLLPRTDAVFGRASKPRSHRLYYSAGATTLQFKDPVSPTMLVELRSNGSNPESVFQTVFPPSLHQSGEVVEWHFWNESVYGPSNLATNGLHGEIPNIEFDALHSAVSCLAAVSLLARHWPRGDRHNLSVFVSGQLAHFGWSAAEASNFIDAICCAAGDEEGEDRLRAVKSTFERFENDEKVGGFGVIADQQLLDSRIIETLRGWLPRYVDTESRLDSSEKRSVIFTRGAVADNVDSLSKIIRETEAPIFEREGAVRLDDFKSNQVEKGIHRYGGVVVRSLKQGYLNIVATREHRWMMRLKDGKYSEHPPPRSAVSAFLDATPAERLLRPLTAIACAPTLRPDTYSVIDKYGYDPDTGIFMAWSGEPLELPDNVSTDALHQSVQLYRDLLVETAFEDSELGLSVVLSAINATLLRPIIGVSPLFLFDAPVAGTGKSYLAELVGLITIGRRPPAMTAGWNDDEFDKRLGTVAMLGDQILLIDNIERELKSDTLCTMITSGLIRVRVLGKSEAIDVPALATVFATGNNVQIYNDLTRRTLAIRLNALQERPETRVFAHKPHQLVASARPTYIAAALNVFRAYMRSETRVDLPPLHGFDEGFDWIRGANVFAGLPDPATAMDLSRSMDAGRVDDSALFKALKDIFPDELEFSARDVHRSCNYHEYGGPRHDAYEVLHGVFGGKTPISIGKILARMSDKIIDGLYLERKKLRSSTLAYKVVRR